MALIDNILKNFGYQKVEKPTSYVADITYSDPLLTFQTPAGIKDYLDIYKNHPWVNACIDKTAEAVASVPFKIYAKQDDELVEVTEGAIYEIFQSVNDYTTVHDFWEQMIIDLEATGNYFAEIVYQDKNPYSLHHMSPDMVKIVPDPLKRIKKYTYTVNARTISLTPESVLHLRYYDPSSPLWGLSPLSSIALTLTADYYARAFNRRFFENDASVPAVLETEKNLQDQDIERLRANWKKAHQGVDKAHNVAVLYGGVQYKPTGTGPKDAQFLELIKTHREEICASLGVPPAVVGIFEYANYANSEAQMRMFWNDKILPLLAKVEQMITEQFIQKFDINCFGKFDVSGVKALQENEAELTDIDVKMISYGLASVNERRAKRGLDPRPGGDEYYMPISLVPSGEDMTSEMKITRDTPHPLDMGRKEIKKWMSR